jgi:hypothetical protein
MSDNESIDTINSVISNLSNMNEDNKSYNIDYDINERLRFLQDKYKDYEFKIIKNILKQKKGTIPFVSVV